MWGTKMLGQRAPVIETDIGGYLLIGPRTARDGIKQVLAATPGP